MVLYLLEVQDIQLFIANRTLSKAEKLIDSHPRGSAQQLNVEDGGALKDVIRNTDVVISLLPWIHQMKVANALNIPEYSVTIKKLEWLGLFSREKFPLETVWCCWLCTDRII